MKHILNLVTFLLAANFVWATPPENKPLSLFENLTPTENVHLSLSTDLTALIANKNKKIDYQDGILSCADGTSYVVGVRARGKFRRRISEIPPIKLKLKKKVLREAGLVDSLNEVKLVLPTTLDEKGNELVVREYLVYRMFEQLSPYSVRARLVQLTLIDTNPKNPKRHEVTAILLEDEEETAARLGGTMLEDVFGLTMDSLQTGQAALVVMFQYMIGNTDWNVEEHRNLRLLRKPDGSLIPIPFDFDFCGFVNAPYATPVSGSGLQSVRQRYLMKGELSNESLANATRILHQNRDAMIGLCRTGHLQEKQSRAAENYIEAFFKETKQKIAGE